MQPATPETVLATFAGDSQTHAGWERTHGRGGIVQAQDTSWDVRYTFGVYPLQQYLLTGRDGRLLVYDLAWDARPAAEGGQRWFAPAGSAPEADSSLPPWAAHAQSWNGQCAACHSTALRKGYDAASDRFETRWAELNVGCEACHGRGSRHVAWAKLDPSARESIAHAGFETQLTAASRDPFRFEPGAAIASGRGMTAKISDPGAELNRCLPCHARRRELSTAPALAGRVLDDYAPSLLEPGLYHPDGQLDDENFEYGSFAQSRMHQAGVTCSHCHDPHSAKPRAEGNQLCAACHEPARFAASEHHHHPLDSPGAQCVSCHMPDKTFMGVHARRDHALRVPRPDLSVELGTPNACNHCHSDRDARWAAQSLERWNIAPPANDLAGQLARAMAAAKSGTANARLVALGARAELAPIQRASALALLRGRLRADELEALRQFARDPDDLVRLGVACALAQIEQPAAVGGELLGDATRAVRIEAARALAGVRLDGALRTQQAQALEEWFAARQSEAERPETHVDMAQVHARLGRAADAEHELRHALRLDPRNLAARINLADLQRALGRDREAEALLRETVALTPSAAVAWHALGLALVRLDQRAAALAALGRAAELAPEEVDYVYVYAIAAREAGQLAKAREVTERALRAHPGSAELAALRRELQ